MIFVAHRGNTDGPVPARENTPGYIDTALEREFDVELDLWGSNGRLWLGHDTAESLVSSEFLKDRAAHLWVHCKNASAIRMLLELAPDVRFFFHQNDDYTMTSDGFVWCYPGKEPPGPRSVIVLPETVHGFTHDLIVQQLNKEQFVGVCSDWVSNLRKNYEAHRYQNT